VVAPTGELNVVAPTDPKVVVGMTDDATLVEGKLVAPANVVAPVDV